MDRNDAHVSSHTEIEDVTSFDVGLGLEDTHVVVTGAAGQIGQVIIRAFLSAGAYVSAFDVDKSRMTLVHKRLSWQTVDVTNEHTLENAFRQAEQRHGVVAACCAVAGLDLSFLPHHATICDLPLEQWQKTMQVNATGTFLTARTWMRGIRDRADEATRNVALVIFGSEAGVFGVPGNADYATSKAAIQYGLARSLAPEAARIFARARVNAIAPRYVLTPMFTAEFSENPEGRYREAEATAAISRPVPMEAVAKACLMLISENFSSSTTGQVIQVDNGLSGRILWDRDGRPGW